MNDVAFTQHLLHSCYNYFRELYLISSTTFRDNNSTMSCDDQR